MNHSSDSKGEVVEENKAALLAYSMECADKYGDAIHLARSLANTFDNTYFDVYDDCPEEVEPRSSLNALGVVVQPNPTKGELIIHLNVPTSGSIEVFNIEGKLIYSDKLTDQSDYRMKLDVNNGIYILNIISEEGEEFFEKIVISK